MLETANDEDAAACHDGKSAASDPVWLYVAVVVITIAAIWLGN